MEIAPTTVVAVAGRVVALTVAVVRAAAVREVEARAAVKEVEAMAAGVRAAEAMVVVLRAEAGAFWVRPVGTRVGPRAVAEKAAGTAAVA